MHVEPRIPRGLDIARLAIAGHGDQEQALGPSIQDKRGNTGVGTELATAQAAADSAPVPWRFGGLAPHHAVDHGLHCLQAIRIEQFAEVFEVASLCSADRSHTEHAESLAFDPRV